MPLLPWLYLVTSALVFIAIGPLTAAQMMLGIDRYAGRALLRCAGRRIGCLVDALLLDLRPSRGLHPGAARLRLRQRDHPRLLAQAIFGYPAMVAATVLIGFISLGVWAHHMFTVGLGPAGNTFFTLATMIISVPTGIKIFNWLATLWGGKIRFATPMIFSIAFLFQFLIAGLTGIMLSAAPFDWQLGNSYFCGGALPLRIGGRDSLHDLRRLLLLVPKMFGRMLSETLGKWHFWLFTIGFHLTFDFMHIPGLMGMPRRIYTYEADRGWAVWNMIESIGMIFQAAAILIFVWNRDSLLSHGEEGRPRPLGCVDAGVVHRIAAAALQLCRGAGGA
jgi:cytochrome c oxidase subunit 1